MGRTFVLILIAVLLVFSLPAGAGSYQTLEGRIGLRGSEPLVEPVLLVEDDEVYTLAGDCEKELKNLSGARVRVTGRLEETSRPDRDGALEVELYTITGLNYREGVDWAVGRVREAEEKLYLLTTGQVVYHISGLSSQARKKLVDTKAVLAGEIEKTGEFTGEVKAESYLLIGEDL